ncbi:MAG: sigma 54-interacting transcriptional regulator [bacterium]
MSDPIRILFLCSHNSASSQMAEGFALARKSKTLEFTSAGTDEPATINTFALRAMKEAGIDISGQKSKSLSNLNNKDFDIVITLCSKSADNCPILPGHPRQVDWNLPDPAGANGNEATVMAVFRKSRDEIKRLVDDLLDRGYIAALAEASQCTNLILDNITDGIIAHDLKRHIFFFNRAAERITGYQRSEILNRDCHEVFPGSFCGGKCTFCDGPVPPLTERQDELDVTTKDGERRRISVSTRVMTSAGGTKAGLLVFFRDVTIERDLARRAGRIQKFAGLVGQDENMLQVFDLIRDVAATNMPVLIQGESGTGKELVAAAIHNEGLRAGKPFIAVNCGALPESLLESELFGHVRGAFTGAIRDKMGRFELADGGTIFLDEIGDISPVMQVRLLRVLQEGRFERVGSEKTIQVDVRIISATNKNISVELASGRFRDDLYYRLSVVPISLPPLRERRNDIPLLAEHILEMVLEDIGRHGVTLSHEGLNVMMSYDWPGNVRELQNWIRFALVKCKDTVIRPEHFPPASRSPALAGTTGAHDHGFGRTGASPSAPASVITSEKQDLTTDSVRSALQNATGNKRQASRLLGVSRATLYRFLDKVGPID